MSYFNHETFGAGHMPPFESIFDLKQKKNTLRSTISETIEDAEYEDITNEQPKAKDTLKYDEEARGRQIIDVALEKMKKVQSKSCLTDILFSIHFLEGATWADKNPIQKFPTQSERLNVFSDAMKKDFEEIEKMAGKKMPEIFIVAFMTQTLGFHWATDNPPKYY